VETKALYDMGIKKGAIEEEDTIIVGVDQGWKLIAAPPTTDELCYSLVFWEPRDEDDHKPTFEKIVSQYFVTLYI